MEFNRHISRRLHEEHQATLALWARVEASLAAANFEMGQHLHRGGDVEAARPFFREAHRLQPDNWTYKREAWSLVDPLQGPSEHYDSDWLSDIRKVGAENYYPKLEL